MTTYPQHIVTVSALVTNADDEVLLLQSPRRGWEFPGGQVEVGENLIQALQREILEETGIAAAIGDLVGVYSNIEPPTKVTFGFLGKRLSGELITSEESLATTWVSRDAVLPMITNPAIRDRMSDMLTFTGRIVYRTYAMNPYRVFAERDISATATT